MRQLFLLTAICLALFVAGCAHSGVQYYTNKSMDEKAIKDSDSYYRFSLQASKIVITQPNKETSAAKQSALGAQGGASNSVNKEPAGDDIPSKLTSLGLVYNSSKQIKKIDDLADSQIIVVPVEAEGPIRFIKPQEGAVTTSLKISYFDGTLVMKSIGTKVEDNRVKYVEAALGTVSSLTGFLKVASPNILRGNLLSFMTKEEKKKTENCEDNSIRLPIVLDFTSQDAFADNGSSDWLHLVNGNECWWYRYSFIAPKAQGSHALIDTETFFRDGNNGMDAVKKRYFPFSACKQVVIQIFKNSIAAKPEGDPSAGLFSFAQFIADPTRLDLLPLPDNGTITMHSRCGADITNDSVDTSSVFDITEAIAKGVSDIEAQAKGDKKQADQATKTTATKTTN